MVGYAPALLAMALNLDGVNIFKEPKALFTGPYLSYFIFMFAIFVILTHINLYPSYFRKLCWCGNILIEFFWSQFMFEYLLHEFWFPVDETVSSIIANSIENADQYEQLEPMKNILEALKSDNTGIVCSYLLSCFFLSAALHATKIIDLRMINYLFHSWQDIIERSENTLASLLKSIYAAECNSKPRKIKSKSESSSKKRKVDESGDDDSGKWELPKKHGRRRP
ncbi:hypothetical protein WA026_007985 [Henosepilachna vigintioctopunctata]|uniref:Uncharacterized protein n=1 Tax=Henosepilachna vigintioctopunctata TaxID=420089 RepID=A0AAW1TIE3_9CUCU